VTATVVEAGDGSGRIVSNPEVGPRGPEMAPDHTRAVDLQGCGERIDKIGAVQPAYRRVARPMELVGAARCVQEVCIAPFGRASRRMAAQGA
jgi:hypothetical protein